MKDSRQTSIHPSLPLDPNEIAPDALQIIHELQNRGFTTYLVGGCVRDLILERSPKDFDIVTNALPKEVRRAVHNSFIIGKRFRLVLVKRGETQYEVSTFRRDPTPEDIDPEGILNGDNIFGSPQEDANRRDFTINALFYDPFNRQLIDYSHGIRDLKAGVVRMIGEPNVRLLEDPIRIMRGIRLAHMIRFSIDPSLRSSIHRHAECLVGSALPRRREEFLKYLRLDNPALPFLTSLDLGVLNFISPSLVKILRDTAKNEVFLGYMFAFHDKKLDSPIELFASLVMAYFLANNYGEFPKDVKTVDILENELYVRLMRDELGMFKHEQHLVAKALHLMTLIFKRSDYENKGEKRRLNLLSNEAFPLALKLAEREHWLSASDLHFWTKELQLVQNSSENRRPPTRWKKKQRRPKKAQPI